MLSQNPGGVPQTAGSGLVSCLSLAPTLGACLETIPGEFGVSLTTVWVGRTAHLAALRSLTEGEPKSSSAPSAQVAGATHYLSPSSPEFVWCPTHASTVYCLLAGTRRRQRLADFQTRWTRRHVLTAKRLCSFCSFGPK